MSASTLLWLPWVVALSGVAGWLALRAWRRSDPVGAVRWSGWALVPPALLLTGTVRLVGRVAGAVTSWAANLVLNPLTWAGILLGVLAVAMIVGSSAMRRRRGPAPSAAAAGSSGSRQVVRRPEVGRAPPVDDDMAEIEEILRRRGIG